MTSILVIEDNPDVCDLLKNVLKLELSAAVKCARTASAAIKAIENAAFDLAIIDIGMPEISGYELAKRAVNRNVPLLLSTDFPDAGERLKETGCPFLARPFLISELIYETANAITHAAENIRLVRTSFDMLVTITEGLKANLPNVDRLRRKRNAFTGQPSTKSSSSGVNPDFLTDPIGEWISSLAPRVHKG